MSFFKSFFLWSFIRFLCSLWMKTLILFLGSQVSEKKILLISLWWCICVCCYMCTFFTCILNHNVSSVLYLTWHTYLLENESCRPNKNQDWILNKCFENKWESVWCLNLKYTSYLTLTICTHIINIREYLKRELILHKGQSAIRSSIQTTFNTNNTKN